MTMKIYLLTVFIHKNSYVEGAYINKLIAEEQGRKIIDEYMQNQIIASVRVELINLIGALKTEEDVNNDSSRKNY